MNTKVFNPAANPLSMAAFISIGLSLLKLGAFFVTGSLVVMSSFLDSLADAIVSFTNSYIYQFARKGPDREHPYGHGGFEVVSGLVQGIVIATFGSVVLFQSFVRLISQENAIEHGNLPIGIGIMFFAAIGGVSLQYFLKSKHDKLKSEGQRSLSLEADRAHYMGDFWMNLAGGLGLLCVWIFDNPALDSAIAIVGAILLINTARPIISRSIADITHKEADKDLQALIAKRVLATDKRILGIHNLRTRELGPTLFVDFHMKLPAELSLQEAHDIGDQTVANLKSDIPRLDAIIHLDPDTEPDDPHY